MLVLFIIFMFGVVHHAKMAAFQEVYLFSPRYNYNGKLLKLIFSCRYSIISLLEIYYGRFSTMINIHVYQNMAFLRNSSNTPNYQTVLFLVMTIVASRGIFFITLVRSFYLET